MVPGGAGGGGAGEVILTFIFMLTGAPFIWAGFGGSCIAPKLGNRKETVSGKAGEAINEVFLMEGEQRLHSRETKPSWEMARRQAGRRAG